MQTAVKPAEFKPTDVTSPGAWLERDLFGRCAIFNERPPWSLLLTGLSHVRFAREPGWDPFDPPTDFARKLRWGVANYFCQTERPKIGLYVALGTPVDFWHGVDAFFEFNGSIATIDVTLKDKMPSEFVHFIYNGNYLYEHWHQKCRDISGTHRNRRLELFSTV